MDFRRRVREHLPPLEGGTRAGDRRRARAAPARSLRRSDRRGPDRDEAVDAGAAARCRTSAPNWRATSSRPAARCPASSSIAGTGPSATFHLAQTGRIRHAERSDSGPALCPAHARRGADLHCGGGDHTRAWRRRQRADLHRSRRDSAAESRSRRPRQAGERLQRRDERPDRPVSILERSRFRTTPTCATSGIFHDAAAYGGISRVARQRCGNRVDRRRARDRQLLSDPGRRAGLRSRLRRRRRSSRRARARRGRVVCLLAEPARRLAVGDRPRDQSERIALRRHRGSAAPLRGGKARTSAGHLAADGASTGSASALGRAAAFARQRRSARCARAALAQHRGQGQTGEHRGPAHRGARRARPASPGCLSSNKPGARLQHGRARRRTGRAGFDTAHALPARGGGRAGAPDRVCQRHQPAGCPLGFTAARDGGQGRSRRQPRAAGAPVADRIGAAGAARRPLRIAAGAMGRTAPAPDRDPAGDRPRRQPARPAVHIRRGRGERHPLRPGAEFFTRCAATRSRRFATKAAPSPPASARRAGGALRGWRGHSGCATSSNSRSPASG